MTDPVDWQCGDCGTPIDGPETRRCPNCGGINFYPLADEIPGEERGQLEFEVDLDEAFDDGAGGDA